MKIRRMLLSLLVSVGMIIGTFSGVPVQASEPKLVLAREDGWNEGENKPNKPEDEAAYSDEFDMDVKENIHIYIGTSINDAVKAKQLDSITIKYKNGDEADYDISPFISGRDDETGEDIVPDEGFFNLRIDNCGEYTIEYGEASATIRVNMPKYGIYSSEDCELKDLIPVEDGRIRFSSSKESTFYAHLNLGTWTDDKGEIHDVEPEEFEFSVDVPEEFSESKINDRTWKITIPSGIIDWKHVDLKSTIKWEKDGAPEYDGRGIDFQPKFSGLVVCWDDNGRFRDTPDDYCKIFNEVPVKTHRRLSVAMMDEDEAGDSVVKPFTGTLTCDNKAVTINKSKDNDNEVDGLYDFDISTSGTYTIKAEGVQDNATVTLNVSLTRAGIYTSAEPSEDTLVCSEWDRLIIKEGTKYYIIPRSFDDEYEVKKVEINFASELGKDKYTWEKGKNSGDPICELVVDNLVDYELGDAICIDIEFERKDNPDDCYRFNTRINVLKSREGMLVSGCWYEDDFRQDVNDFSKQSSAVTFWDTGICLGIAAEIDGQNIITPITDISKLDIVRIVDGEETTVSSDVAHLNNTYESWDDKQQKDIEKKTQPGVYRLRIEEPGEYRIKYKNDSDPMFVTIYVDDPAGAYYTDKPESGNAMKNIINPNKDENFEYDENNRTFYFAFRPIQEKDDKGTVIRKYAYGNGQTEERQDGNGRNYNAAIESNGFVLCKNYHDDEKNIDVLEPIEDSDYALIEKIQENIGEYEVYKVTLGETYDGCGLMTRLVKKKLEWKGNGYSDQYLDDGWDDFYINIKEKRSGLMIGWLDGESFPEDLSKFDKTKDLDICWEHRVAMGMFTESENGDSVTPITGTLSLTDKAGKPVDDNASISEIGNGIYKFKTSVCGQYKVTYTTDDGEYSAYIFSKLPDIAFYSSNVPSDLNIVNSGAEEYIYEKGDTYYLCHNINEWQLKNKLDSITVSSPSFEEENVKNYKASELINNNVLDEIVITDDMEEAYYRITLNWKDNGHEQKDFHFMKAADGFAVGWPGNNDVCSTNPKDYQEQIHVNVRCHEWRTFANISINDEGEKVVEPIAATDINLAKFEITDIEGNNVDPEEAYIKFANKDGSDLDGIFELYFKNPGIYRVYYGDEYVTVRVAFVEVAFANKEGTYNEKDYEILSDDLFTAVMQPVDEEDFYIATFDGSGMGENSYNKATITGIKADNGIDKYFKCMISADGSSASVHVDREIGANRIEFEVTYKCIEYEKNDSTYVPRGDGWDGKDTFAIEIPEDPRELIEIGNDVSWNYEEPFIFDNEEKGVELTGFDEESAKFIDVTYTDNKKTDIGKYTAKAELKIKDDYKTEYKLPRQIPEELTSLEWEIVIPLNIKGLIDGINALPDKDKIKITDKANIESIRKSYDVLKDFEKAVVGKDVLKKLTDAEATIKDIEKNAKDAEQKATDDKLAAEKVNKLINALPAATSVKTTDEANIKAARTAYNALTADQKKLISADVLKKLTDVESALDKLKKNEEKPKKLLKVGDNIVDSNSKATYKVLVVGTKSKSGEVSIVKPNDAKVKKFSIPKNIYVDGVTYAVTEISANAFKGKNQLTTVTIPATVTKIGKNAFYGCKKLKKVKVPNIVTSIGVGAFQNCTSLTQATLGKGITAIPNDAFSGCKKLTSIVIPVEVKTIGKRAFYGCSALKNITVKTKKLKSVGSNALKGIRKDAVIKVPKAKVNDYRKVFRKKGQAATVMVVG